MASQQPPPAPPQPSNMDHMDLLRQVVANQTQMQLQLDQMTAKLSQLSDQIGTAQHSTHTRLDTLKSCINSLDSRMTDQSHQISQNHRHATLQILQLQNPTKKHYTLLMSLPVTIVSCILSWIHPLDVWGLRGVSRAFEFLVSSQSFAHQNLARFCPPPDPSIHESYTPSFYDDLYLRAPSSFQTAFVQTQWKHLRVIEWDAEHTGAYEMDLVLDITIPDALVYCQNLVELHLRCCTLKGPIPLEIGLLTSLFYLDLSCNGIDGVIPTSIGKLKNLKALFLVENELSGPIPSEMGDCIALSTLNLSNNFFLDGPLPGELGNLQHLKVMNFSACAFTGGIPSEFGRLGKLERLVLRANRLSGEVPVELGSLSRLRIVDLSCNRDLVCSFDFRAGLEFTI
ncbi:hypothetical protein HDU98_007293 [Podochytrium sp. JEL0797]|nr:hypothetical protein HDU98_007293 [Podochytrium sp. JEL0797]